MNNYKIFNKLNYKLRSTAKSLLMNNYCNGTSNMTPINYNINKISKKIAFTNCSLFDGLNPGIMKDITVLINGSKVTKIFKNSNVKVFDDYYIIDAEGQTMMPGIIDNHVHACSPFTYDVNIEAIRQMLRQVVLNNVQTVFNGVTTICEMGGPQSVIKEFTEVADKNIVPGPRYINCFTLIAPKRGQQLGYPPQVKELNTLTAWLLEGQVATRPRTLKELRQICQKVKDDGGHHLKATYQAQPFSKKSILNLKSSRFLMIIG